MRHILNLLRAPRRFSDNGERATGRRHAGVPLVRFATGQGVGNYVCIIFNLAIEPSSVPTTIREVREYRNIALIRAIIANN